MLGIVSPKLTHPRVVLETDFLPQNTNGDVSQYVNWPKLPLDWMGMDSSSHALKCHINHDLGLALVTIEYGHAWMRFANGARYA